ncbi:MAG: putative DNA-binding regulatory protein [Myxococcales bacterium]|nr:putative DNA-binding regulatory protein [Myxococcales bacterium]
MSVEPASEAAWTRHLEVGRAAWPSLVWDAASYRAWLIEACDGDLASRLATLDPAETVLCWAAGHGDAEAHRLVELHYMQQVAPALRRFGPDPAFVDEVAQRVRMKLLVAPAGELAPIARYALGGGLGGLVRVAAIREALTLRRLDKPVEPAEALEDLVGEQDPELRALKERYAHEFQRAFTAAVAELAPRDRHILRLNLSAKASIDDIARIHRTHRATAARWLTAAREQLAEGTRRHLQAGLQIEPDELQSLLRLIRTEAPRMLESIPPDRDP